MSSDGTKLAAAYDQGYWTSYDSGATWSQDYDTSNSFWSDLRDIAMSDDGNTMAVVESFGNPHTSSDGYNWNSASSNYDDDDAPKWQAIAMRPTGAP